LVGKAIRLGKQFARALRVPASGGHDAGCDHLGRDIEPAPVGFAHAIQDHTSPTRGTKTAI
jgi:hypothetical protein